MVKLLASLITACTIYMTNYPGEADYRVYLTQFRGEDTAQGLFKDCTFDDYPTGFKVYITDFKGEADLIVYDQEFGTDQ